MRTLDLWHHGLPTPWGEAPHPRLHVLPTPPGRGSAPPATHTAATPGGAGRRRAGPAAGLPRSAVKRSWPRRNALSRGAARALPLPWQLSLLWLRHPPPPRAGTQGKEAPREAGIAPAGPVGPPPPRCTCRLLLLCPEPSAKRRRRPRGNCHRSPTRRTPRPCPPDVPPLPRPIGYRCRLTASTPSPRHSPCGGTHVLSQSGWDAGTPARQGPAQVAAGSVPSEPARPVPRLRGLC